MNYLGLIALTLGLISVIITMKTLNKYDELNNKISNVTIQTKQTAPSSIIDLQSKLNLTESELNSRIDKKQNDLVSLLKEPFKQVENFLASRYSFDDLNKKEVSYLTTAQRSCSIGLPYETSPIIKSIETEPIQHIITYEDEKKLAMDAISKQPKVKEQTSYLAI
jgi:hypothetical protein